MAALLQQTEMALQVVVEKEQVVPLLKSLESVGAQQYGDPDEQ